MNNTKHFAATKKIIHNGETDVLGLASSFFKIFIQHLELWSSEV